MKEYSVLDFCLSFEILFYESDVKPFAYSEGWYARREILDGDGNPVDYEVVLDRDAINDTLSRLHADMKIDVVGDYIIV